MRPIALILFANVFTVNASYADSAVYTVSIQGEHSFVTCDKRVLAHNVSLRPVLRNRTPKLALQLMRHVDALRTELTSASTQDEAALAIAKFGKSAGRISDKLNSDQVREVISRVVEAAQSEDYERTWRAIQEIDLRIASIFLYQETHPGFSATRHTTHVYELAARRYELGDDLESKASALGYAAGAARTFDPVRAAALLREAADTYVTILRTTQPVLFEYILRGSKPRTRRLDDWKTVRWMWGEVIRYRDEADTLTQ